MVELERRRYRTTHERPRPEASCRLPHLRRHHELRPFAGPEIGSEDRSLHAPSIRVRAQLEGRARVEVPDFRRVEPMPVRALSGLQKIVNRGASAPLAVTLVSPGLAEMPPFGVWSKLERADHVGRSHVGSLRQESRSRQSAFPIAA